MRIHKLVLMLALVSLAAPASALADEGTRATHFQGWDRGTFTVTPTDDQTVVSTEERTTGYASGGIGRYTLVASELVNLATSEVTDGAWTLTARKGTLVGTYAGSATPPNAHSVITYHVRGRITGGTGRFAGARGNVVFDGVASLATLALSETMRGRLVLPSDDDESRLPADPQGP
jgi:hypothetical protein